MSNYVNSEELNQISRVLAWLNNAAINDIGLDVIVTDINGETLGCCRRNAQQGFVFHFGEDDDEN